MKNSILLLSTFIFLAITHYSNSQSKWDKMIIKSDNYYDQGDYANANKNLQKFKKKVIKTLGKDNKYMPGYYLRLARYNFAWGYLADFEANINSALALTEKKYGEKSLEHARFLLEAANDYVLYGNFAKAEQFLNQASRAIKSNTSKDENLEAKIKLMTSKVYAGQGYYLKSHEYLDEIEQYFSARAVTKETSVSSSGKMKSTKLSQDEITERMGEYASLKTLRAYTYGAQGDIKQADVEFAKASQWIEDKLKKKHFSYVYNNFLWGKMLEDNGVINLTKFVKQASYEKSLSLIQKDYNASHYLTFDIYERLLKNYLLRDENSKYRSVRADYERNIKLYFKKNSIHYNTLDMIEFNTKLSKEKTKNLQKEANEMLTNSSSIPKNHAKRTEILNLLLDVALTEKDYRNAEGYLTQIVKINKYLYGENAPLYHLSKIKLANFYLDYTGKFDEAGKIYEESFENIVNKEINHWHVDYLDILNHLATYYEANDNFKKASEYLTKASKAADEKYPDGDVAYGKELNYLAKIQIKIGQYDKAKKNLSTALEILSDDDKPGYNVIDHVGVLETQSKLLAIMGDFDEAESNLNDSKRLLRKADNLAGYNELSSKQELADLYIALGKYSDTNEILTDLIEEYQKRYGSKSRNLIEPMVNYGKLKMITGDYTEAEKTARKVNQIAHDIYGDKSSKVASSLILLAEINSTLGDYEHALEYCKKAKNIQEKRFGSEHIDVAKSTNLQALILFYQGGFEAKAEKLMTTSKDIIADKIGSRTPLFADMITDLSKIYIVRKKYDKAFNALDLAEKIWLAKAGKRNNINAAKIYTLKGDLYYQQFDYTKAEEYYEKSRRLYEKFFSDKHPDYVKVVSKLSKVYYMSGDTRRAKKYINESIENYNGFIKKYFPALSEREKAKFWNTIKDDYEYYNTVAFRMMNEDPSMLQNVYNNALTTKALLLSSSLKIKNQILNSNNEDLIKNFNLWEDKKELLTQALSMSAEQQVENGINAVALATEVELIEKQLSEQSAAFSKNTKEKIINWEQVRKVLKTNEVAIEMVRYRKFDHVFTDEVIYAALYLKNEKSTPKPKVAIIPNGKDLEHKYFKFYRNSIIYKIEDNHSYEEYWKPIMQFAGGINTIFLSADGVYNQINLETIPIGDGKYVLDNSNIVLVSNTKDIYYNRTRTREVQKDKRALMFGDPDFYLKATASNKIADLPGTAKEVNELHQLLKQKGWVTEHYLEKKADEDQIKSLDNPKIFHIATHGFFKPSDDVNAATNNVEVNENKAYDNPLLRTGLLMKGAGDILDITQNNYNRESGILTAYEAMNLNLDKTELVVLSACETGLGDLQVGEGVYGLQRAFLVAGARTLIMSMFKVDDTATQKLMVAFYKKWLNTGNMRQAFVDAKKEVRNEYKDPIYWGAFIMIGME